MYYSSNGRQYIGQYKDIYDKYASTFLPNAGYIRNTSGLDLTLSEIEFLVAVQADGYYMIDNGKVTGIEFHLTKERKINRIKSILNALNYPYKICLQSNNTTKIRIYGKEYYDWCERYLDQKRFTWEWLNMSKEQARYFLDVVLLYDGCVANNSYSSSEEENLNIVQAIAALNGIGTKLGEKRVYFKSNKRSLGDAVKKRNARQKVSCVTVKSGFILIRQHGRTTITGNCPATWIKSHTQEICDKVNAQLNQSVGLYFKTLISGDPIYAEIGKPATGKITTTTKYTIVEEKVVDNIKYGKLKSGAGWVILERLKRTFNIQNEQDVKDLQNALNARGFKCGTADGVIGAKTQNAMFQALCEIYLI
jgi:uncharacterized protein (UPF0297 family)